MSVPVNLRHHPAQHHAKQSAYFPVSADIATTTSTSIQQHNKMMPHSGQSGRHGVVPLSFPATNTALWDKTPIGLGTTLHITQERNLYVHILEKTLRLAYRHASQLSTKGKNCKCFLIGQALTNADDDGVTVTVDRFDPGREIPSRPGSSMPTAKLPGDHVIPLTLSINKEFDSTTHTEEDFKTTFQLLQHHCCSRESVDVANLVSLRIHCCCYANDDDITFSLHVAGVTIATPLDLTPISAIPIIPTALARNLQGPLNLSEIQGNPKSGFVTLDQTRKLLLLLQSDPKAYSLPLVGIWLSGISYIGSPVIWATCLHYMFNNSIQERVCSASEGFLVILYSPNKRKPDFYQCNSSSSDGRLSFQLVGCRENLHVFKHADVTNHGPIQLELRTARDGPNKSVFLQAYNQYQPLSWNTKGTPSGTATGSRQSASKPGSTKNRMSETEDDIQMIPRPSPKPIMDKSPSVRPSVPELSLIFDNFEEPQQHSPELSPKPYIGKDDVFLLQNAPAGRTPQQHPHHLKENPPQTHTSKPGHLIQDRSQVIRPGPLKTIDQNSPNVAGRKVNSQRAEKISFMESHPRQHFGAKHGRTGGTVMMRSNSEPSMVGKGNGHTGRHSTGHQQQIPRQNATGVMIGQRIPSAHASANKIMPPGRVENFQGQNASQGGNHAGVGQRRASAPIPRQDDTADVIGQDLHIRQSLPNGRSPYRHPQQQPGHLQSTGPSQTSVSNQIQNGAQNMQQPKPQSGLTVPTPQSQPQHERTNQRSDTNSQYVCNTMDMIPEGGSATMTHFTKPAHSSPNRLVSSNVEPNPPLSHGTMSHQSVNSTPHHPHASENPHRLNAVTDRTPNQIQPVTRQHQITHNISTPALQNSQSNRTQRTSPVMHTGSQCQRGLDDQCLHSNEMDTRPNSTQRTSPNRHTSSSSCQNQRGPDDQSLNSNEGDGSSTLGSVASQDAYEQLRRQEVMIRELQAQIQMLLKAQQAASIPSGVMTPPATPTSTPSANQMASTPINHADTPPSNKSPPNDGTSRHANHHSPPTRHVAMATSPSKSVKCSVGVNTGQSLFCASENDAVKNDERSLPTETISQKSTPQRSPYHSHPITKDTGNSTFDLDSEPNMSLIVEGARDETHSGISMIGPIEMNSSFDSTSKMSSPKRRSPGRGNGDNDPSNLSDSFRSPVLGESASTCRPPGRPIVSSDSEEDDDVMSKEAGAPSLLYKDQRKFYANILGNVQQLLNDPTKPNGNQPVQGTSNNSSSASDSSSSEDSDDEDSSEDSSSDDVAMATKEEQGLLGLKLSLPEDFESGSAEKSTLYRSMYNSSPDFFPRINYVSIMDFTLDSPNLSMEANALAMKYLSDEELAKLSIGFKSQTAATPRKDVNPLLRTALVGNRLTEKSMIGVSSVGFAAVDMSMASRKYMEKYGLLEIGEAKDETSPVKTKNQLSPKKKTKRKKKSKTKKLEAISPLQPVKEASVKIVPPKLPVTDQAEAVSPLSDQHLDRSDRIRATPTLHPDSQQVSPISQAANETYEPWLNKPPKKLREGTSTEAFQTFAKDHIKGHNTRGQNAPRPVGNILDISRLQELPKLL